MSVLPNFRPLPRPPPCLICNNKSAGCLYGVFSCHGCKTFFRRAVDENRKYKCKDSGTCLETKTSGKKLCRFCRFQRCREVGMLTPEEARKKEEDRRVQEVENSMDKGLRELLDDLIARDTALNAELAKHDQNQNVPIDKRLIGQFPLGWSLSKTLEVTSSFIKFRFLDQLTRSEVVSVFDKAAGRLVVFGCAMTSALENNNTIKAVGNQEDVENNNPKKPDALGVLHGRVMSRMMELKVTREEFVLLQMIIFCNPGFSSFSGNAQDVLGVHQSMFNSALLQLCQLYHPLSASSRLVELLSLSNIIHEGSKELEYNSLILRFPFH